MTTRRAAVVGAGPNGLAAAIELARRGYDVKVFEAASTIGGGSRTTELIESDHFHDVCAAAHPLGAISPFFTDIPLEQHGLEWITPDVAFSHPLGDGTAAVVYRSIDRTTAQLGADGDAYRRLVGPVLNNRHVVVGGALSPLMAAWRHPVSMGKFGIAAVRSVAAHADRFSTPGGKALLAGLGAHSIARLDAPATGGVALLLAAAAHLGGWPIARGGSQSIVNAMASYLESIGGTIFTKAPVESLDQFDPATAVFLDTSPGAAVRIGGRRISATNQLTRWKHGPGSHKVDWILSDPIPWADGVSASAATVHIGGTFDEIRSSEQAVMSGRVSPRPFVIVTQPSHFDSTRAPAGRHIGWAYCHVPSGFDGDATAIIEAQVERYAPGFKDVIVARHSISAHGFEEYNPNYVGGDIGGGAFKLGQLLLRPRLGRNPYRIGDGVYLCSASTPPGAGVHGMCGYNAVAYSAPDLR